MAKELTQEGNAHFSELEKNFSSHVASYREKVKEKLQLGREADLKEELRKLEEYLAIYHRGDVGDLKVNIDFTAAKIWVLKESLAAGY